MHNQISSVLKRSAALCLSLVMAAAFVSCAKNTSQTDDTSAESETEVSYPQQLTGSTYISMFSDISQSLNDEYEKYSGVRDSWKNFDSEGNNISDSLAFFNMIETTCSYLDSISSFDTYTMQKLSDDSYSLYLKFTTEQGNVNATFKAMRDGTSASENITVENESGEVVSSIRSEFCDVSGIVYFSQAEYEDKTEAASYGASEPGFAFNIGTYTQSSNSLSIYFINSDTADIPLYYVQCFDKGTDYDLNSIIGKFNGQMVEDLYSQYTINDGIMKYVCIPAKVSVQH